MLHERIKGSAQNANQDQAAGNEGAGSADVPGGPFPLGSFRPYPDRLLCAARHFVRRRIRICVLEVREDVRREAEGRPLRQRRQDFRRARIGGGGRCLHSLRHRQPTAPQRLYGIAQQPHRLLRNRALRHPDFPRHGFLLRPGSGRHQILRRTHLRHRFAAGQHAAAAIPAGAAAHHQPHGPHPREAALREIPRYPAGAGAGRNLRRRQALLPAFRLRPHAHHQGRLRRPARPPQGTGRFHPDHAAGAHVLAGPGQAHGTASWRK